jgi:hypothetical protein
MRCQAAELESWTCVCSRLVVAASQHCQLSAQNQLPHPPTLSLCRNPCAAVGQPERSLLRQWPQCGCVCSGGHSQPVAVWWPCHQHLRPSVGGRSSAAGCACTPCHRPAPQAASRGTATAAGDAAQGLLERSGKTAGTLQQLAVTAPRLLARAERPAGSGNNLGFTAITCVSWMDC